MINRTKLEHILEYARQQRHTGQHCKIPPGDMVEIMEIAMRKAGNSPVTTDGWISCSERMPNDKQYVWCWGKSYGWTECDTFEGYYDCSRNKWWAVTDNGEEPASKVTHWMPLPELKWHTEFGHLNRGDMLTSEQHRCSNEKKKFQRRV